MFVCCTDAFLSLPLAGGVTGYRPFFLARLQWSRGSVWPPLLPTRLSWRPCVTNCDLYSLSDRGGLFVAVGDKPRIRRLVRVPVADMGIGGRTMLAVPDGGPVGRPTDLLAWLPGLILTGPACCAACPTDGVTCRAGVRTGAGTGARRRSSTWAGAGSG